MTTTQDLLSLDGFARMNSPSVASGNWQWRVLPSALNDAVAAWLKELTALYGRLAEKT